MIRRGTLLLFIGSCIALLSGCNSGESKYGYGYGGVAPANVKFHDDVEPNVEFASGPCEMRFVDAAGNEVSLADYQGRKRVVLVFTRGFYGQICPYCATQTSRLIANYDEICKREAEIVVVFPGDGTKVQDFVKASLPSAPDQNVPFPIVLDETLAAVDQMAIRGNLAKPSTYILDKQGEIRFAYVGATEVDRPSIKAVLAQLDAIRD